MANNNKTALITGASSGLGLNASRALAAKGYNLIMASRGEAKLEIASAEIKAQYPDVQISQAVLDVSNFDQVRDFAKTTQQPIDVLMNNAGVMGPDFSLSVEGIESQMAINHLGHFLLTSLLWDNLEQSESPRVVSLSSTVHRRGKLETANVSEITGSDKASYDRWQRYADTKLACLLFARELDIRAKQAKSKVISIAAHPGWAITGLQDNFPHRLDRFAQTAAEGAQSQIDAAINPLMTGGEFVGPSLELWGKPRLIKGTSRSRDLGLMGRLWTTSEELTGSKFEL